MNRPRSPSAPWRVLESGRSVRRQKWTAQWQKSLDSHAAKSRAAAERLSIITVDVLLIAGSVGSILVARGHCHWSVGSPRAYSRRASSCTINCVGTRAVCAQLSIDIVPTIYGDAAVRV